MTNPQAKQQNLGKALLRLQKEQAIHPAALNLEYLLPTLNLLVLTCRAGGNIPGFAFSCAHYGHGRGQLRTRAQPRAGEESGKDLFCIVLL